VIIGPAILSSSSLLLLLLLLLLLDCNQRKTVAYSPGSAVRSERGQLSSPVRGQTVREQRAMRPDLRQVQMRLRQTLQLVGQRTGVVRRHIVRALHRSRSTKKVRL